MSRLKPLLFSAVFCVAASTSWAQGEPASALSGKELYKAHCALCHGGKGQGVAPMFPPLNAKPVEAYAAMMQNYRAGHGHKVMVDMAKSLTEVQTEAILGFVATFSPSAAGK